MSQLHTQFIDSIQSIPRDAWNAVSGTDYPFIRHEFLSALEESGSVSPETGWTPSHIVIRNDSGAIVGLMPTYAKDNSYGEYVFDWSWANAYYQHGLPYYPKLLTAIPFTPCVGPRLVMADDIDIEFLPLLRATLEAVLAHCQSEGYSSWHMLFPTNELTASIAEKHQVDAVMNDAETKLMRRMGSQFHWYNRGYKTFDDYLAAMTSRKRKSVRKERQKVADQGITFLHVNGRDITPRQLDEFYVFYHATYMKRGQQGYLNRSCFDYLVRDMPENLHFVFARKCFSEEELAQRNFFWKTEEGEEAQIGEEESIAAALFLQGGDTIYGRYWGCLDEFDHLHFETCYYQGIDYCIEENFAHFDAGAQGEHKIQRGFEPIETYSFHWIAHPEFRHAIHNFLKHEQVDVAAYIEDAASYLPFKQES